MLENHGAFHTWEARAIRVSTALQPAPPALPNVWRINSFQTLNLTKLFFFWQQKKMAAKAQKRAAWSRTIISPSACSFFMFVLYAWCACQVSCEGSECASYALGTQFETLQLARTVTKPAQTIAHRSLALRGAGGEQAGVSFTSCSAK